MRLNTFVIKRWKELANQIVMKRFLKLINIILLVMTGLWNPSFQIIKQKKILYGVIEAEWIPEVEADTEIF